VKQVQEYFGGLFKACEYSSNVADQFRVGDNWKAQQRSKKIFFAAFVQTLAGEGLKQYYQPEIPPFDELEAVIELLNILAINKLLAPILEPIEKQEMPAAVKNQTLNSARNAVVTAIEKGAQAWAPLQVAAAKAGEIATKAVSDSADKFVNMLKDLIAKVVNLIKEKMGDEKDEKEDKKEEKSSGIGSISSVWKFEKTDVGKKFAEHLLKETSDVATKHVSKDIMGEIQNHVRKPIEAARKKMAEVFKVLNNKFIRNAIEHPVTKIMDFIIEITSLEGFLAAGEKFGATIAELEKKYVAAAGKKADLEKLVDEASHALWLALADECVTIWEKIYGLKAKVAATFSGDPEYVTEPLVDLFQGFFRVQIKGLNSIRILYCKKLRATLPETKDADGASQASRTALRDAIFPTIDTLVNLHWVATHDALTGVLKAYIVDKFTTDVWPELSKPLEELQSAIPEEIAKMGLDVVALGLSIVTMLLESGVGFVAVKVGMILEESLFGQGGSYGGSGEGVSD